MNPNAFETDVMDDLSFDEAEGPASGPQAYEGYDPYAEGGYGDEYDTYDEEAADDEFLSGMIRPGGVSSAEEFDEVDEEFDEADEYEGMEAYDEFEAEDSYDPYEEDDAFEEESMDPFEALEDAVADALASGDSDEMMRKIRGRVRRLSRGLRGARSLLRRGLKGVTRIAVAIPGPYARGIQGLAGLTRRLLADGADDYEALDAMIDMAGEQDVLDPATPLIAGLALHAGTPQIIHAPRRVRREAVRALSDELRTLAHRHGPEATKALVRGVRAIGPKGMGRQPVPVSAIPSTIRRLTPRIARNPRHLRRLSRPLTSEVVRSLQRMDDAAAGMRPPLARRGRRARGGLGPVQRRRRPLVAGRVGAHRRWGSSGPRQLVLRGPVTLTLHSRF